VPDRYEFKVWAEGQALDADGNPLDADGNPLEPKLDEQPTPSDVAPQVGEKAGQA
jgi:hypothetical protein